MLRERDYLKAWVLFFLMATLGGSLFGAIVGLALGTAFGAAGYPPETITRYASLAGYLVSLPVSYVCFRHAARTWLVEKLAQRQADAEKAI